MVAKIIILNIFILKCLVLLGFEITEIINFEGGKGHFKYIWRPIFQKGLSSGQCYFHQYKAFTRGFQKMKYGRLEQQTVWENEYAKCFMWHFLALVSDFKGSKNDVPLSRFF